MNTDISLVYLLYKVLQLNSNIETDNSEISNHLLVKIFISQGYTQVDAELLCISMIIYMNYCQIPNGLELYAKFVSELYKQKNINKKI